MWSSKSSAVAPSRALSLSRLPPRKAGRAAALVLSPHLVFGTWLTIVPDHRAFLTSQMVTIAHVGLAILTLPLITLWIVMHASRSDAQAARQMPGATAVRWTLTLAIGLMVLTGTVVVWGGNITPAGRIHSLGAFLVGIPLAVHLYAARQRRYAAGVLLLLAVANGGALAARRFLPATGVGPATPAFAYVTRPVSLYESASWCGECHGAVYDEWKRSTHARTLASPNVRSGLEQPERAKSIGFDLSAIGKIIGGARPPDADAAFFACESCHAPATFYGDDPVDMRKATGVVAEAITCSFCHTLRSLSGAEVDKEDSARRHVGTMDMVALLPEAARYVSAPETVRRYLGQGSNNRVIRKIGDYLIRWRPAMHSADYGTPFLRSSRFCAGCHSLGNLDADPIAPHKTYVSWRQSTFNTGNENTTVNCQDCHMAWNMTGEHLAEPARFVSWGPVRPNGRSHLILGGNVAQSLSENDVDYAQLQHEFNTRAVSVRVGETKRDGDSLSVTFAVRAELVGHFMPGMETHRRYSYIEVLALDAKGARIVATEPPRNDEDFESASPLLFRCTQQPKPECDTLLRPKETRSYTVTLKLPPGAVPARVEAIVHHTVDDRPIARDSRAID